ncbi:type I-E CRISPR-associated protein Cas7/Cse4/CasC [Streptomyces sp. NBC_00006]|uniref:type I-E CRISPR-associated protein Cas7/Cse4/CasC n=1 Tax=Streptomyces sp. NBC_00006 TaxID=2975619 RepID=UPI0022564E0C|nr:type I-E CRISPR-associated protein Cas7/Cse4/CasC [Streptomyces sp. NBC_00006]MCX5535178.1 type I-E CRISPR-associated protein Cas7/Cse4/CasC [Streptomyces sp. NBC_00006]
MTSSATPLYLDVHIVHSTPYANLNRDRLNAPKSATYGGVNRPRLSSQHGRRHSRRHMETALGVRALRTRTVPAEVAERLTARGWDAETALVAGQLLILAADVKGLGISEGGGTNALLFLPNTAFDALAAVADTHRAALTPAAESAAKAIADAKKKADAKQDASADESDDDTEEQDTESGPLAAALKKIPATERKTLKQDVLNILRQRNASIAAYGRFLANEPGSIVDGAIQIAHSLATHAGPAQIDFFSAVDDVLDDTGVETGAGHMGDQRYTSATFYRYGTLNVRELVDNLDGDTPTAHQVVEAFLHAFPLAVMPAKASGTAPHTIPHLIHVAVRTDRPINLVGAYETAIPATTDGYLPASMAALDQHAAAHTRMLGTTHLADSAHVTLTDTEFAALGDHVDSFDQLVHRALTSIAKHTA